MSTESSRELRQRIGLVTGGLVFVLLAALPAPEGMGSAAWKTAAVAVLMAIWWMTEALPIPVTALLPIVLLPLLGVSGVREATAPYGNPLIFLFLGGFLIAIAMQSSGLHRRLALRIIAAVGTSPRRIIAGFMIASAFLSMWISNTATTLMMLPIALSVVGLVEGRSSAAESRSFSTTLLLSIAYACSIGGLGTLIGTPTNALLAAFILETYGFELPFATWMALALPLVVVGLVLTYLSLTRLVYPIRMRQIPDGRNLIRRELENLGPVSRQERTVAAVFALTAVLWMTRPLLLQLIPGLSDTGIAVFGAILLFILPAKRWGGRPILVWKAARDVPWAVLLLFGGGLSLASAIQRTGLADWLGGGIRAVAHWPGLAVTLLIVIVVILLTEMTSNTATTAAFLPVLASVAAALGRDPLILLIPATLAASCAFMLPVATPPNAIVYGSGLVSVPSMVRAGVVLNLLFVVLIATLAYTVLPLVVGSLRPS